MDLIQFMDDPSINKIEDKGILIGANISDLHFGVTGIDVATQYNIFKEQFVEEVEDLPLDYVAICGDLTDHKGVSSSDMIMYLTRAVDLVVTKVCRPKNIPLIIVAGTYNHDANQLKIFYHYLDDPTVDVRIMESIDFTYIRNKNGYMCKVLCIPELYGVDESVYQHYLFESGLYDMCLMHGTIKGAVPKDTVGEGRLFHIEDFINCMGPTIAGHVHGGGCFNKHFYYCGSPYSWRFDDDYRKGFLLSLHNLSTHQYYIYKQLIHSFRFETVNLDFMLEADPKSILEFVYNLKREKGIDYIKLKFEKEVSPATKDALTNFFKNTKDKLEFNFTKEDRIIKQNLAKAEELQKYAYLFDKNMNQYEKFARYINDNQQEVIITADELKLLAEEE